MNNFFKIAAGILGGVAIIMSLGGMSKKGDERRPKEEHISDEILDGNLREQEQQQQPREENRGEKIRRGTEENVRNLQESLSRASNVLGHISIICNSIVKIFNQDPCVKVTPTTYIL